MEIKSRFDHFNINVLDLERSIAFYNKALGLNPGLPDGQRNRLPAGTDLVERP